MILLFSDVKINASLKHKGASLLLPGSLSLCAVAYTTLFTDFNLQFQLYSFKIRDNFSTR